MLPLRPQEVFGRYVIEELLGTGGMGEVYRATDEKLHRQVALKVLRTDPDRSRADIERATARLFREARAAAALEHANAVSIFDVGEVNGRPFIAMELIVGRSLRSFVGDLRVPISERVRWLISIARALGAAHARGLIHRDVKPDNVMVRDDGTVKVLDFGIARQSHAAVPSSNPPRPAEPALTAEGMVLGTPHYMAPEQLRDAPLDGRADQFSWGVLAYEILTGALPWAGVVGSYQLVAAVMTGEVRPPRELAPDLPPAVEQVVLKTLSKAPESRFSSMDEVARALSPFASEEVAVSVAPTMQAYPSTPSPHLLPTRPSSLQPSRTTGGTLSHPAVGWGLAVATTLAAATATWLILQKNVGPKPAPKETVAPPPHLIAVTDLPVPESTVPAAKAKYAAALQLLRDGSETTAAVEFAKAAEEDPLMAAAHLRAHLYGGNYSEVGTGHFQRALDLRSNLSARDQSLLDAVSPAYLALPRDFEEAAKRARGLAAGAPLDAELQFIAAMLERDKTSRVAHLEEVAKLDPHFATPLWLLASDQMQLTGPATESVGQLISRCLEVSPTSQSCLLLRTSRDDATGRCAQMEQDAQQLIARNGSGRSYDVLARALYARGAPVEAVKAALSQKWASPSDPDAMTTKAQDEIALSVLTGDFATAERDVRALEERIAGRADEAAHERPAWLHADLALEMGRDDLSAKIADDYLRKRAGWKTDGTRSPRPVFFAMATRGGLRTPSEKRADLDDWLHEWKTDAWYERERWIHGYAFSARTAAEAEAALGAAPSPVPPVLYRQGRREEIDAVGRLLLLAKRPADALPHLKEAAASCSAIATPFAHTRANLELGQALEATGDSRAACAAYGVVLARWGHAKPRSVSAELARARSAALHCGG